LKEKGAKRTSSYDFFLERLLRHLILRSKIGVEYVPGGEKQQKELQAVFLKTSRDA
jgi:hypothetical protein